MSASPTGPSVRMTTCTRRCPQSGAGDTSSTNRSFKPSSVCRSASARLSARCTCRQNCRALRSICLPDDKRSDVLPPRAWANSGSTKSADPFGRRLRCFKAKLPLLRKHAHPARTQTRTLWPSTWLLLKAMRAGPAGRIAYAAAGRLDGIGRRAIGDMVSSAVASS